MEEYELLFEDYSVLSDIYSFEEQKGFISESYIRLDHAYAKTESCEILLEGAMDILDTIKEAIKRMIESIKKFFNKVIMYFNSYLLEMDKFVKKYKEELNEAKVNAKFKIDGYEFTVLGTKPPKMDPFKKLVADYNSDIAKMAENLKESGITKESIKKESIAFLSDSNLESLRGTILGTNTPIAKEDFLEEIRKHYRGGEIDTTSIEIDSTDIERIMDHAKELVTAKNESIKTRNELLALLNKAENFFGRKVKTVYDSANQQAISYQKIDVSDGNKFKTEKAETKSYSDDKLKILNTYVEFKYKQTQELASMINLVASERANALKDQIKQETTILRKCIFGGKSENSEKIDGIQDCFSIKINTNSTFVLEGTLGGVDL